MFLSSMKFLKKGNKVDVSCIILLLRMANYDECIVSVQLLIVNCNCDVFCLTGRPKSARSERNVSSVRNLVLDEPTKSIRAIASDTGLKRESIRRILHTDMKFKPYKIPVVQKLNVADLDARVEACQKFIDMLAEEPDIKTRLLMTDESIFTLDNTVSPCHARHWSPTKPKVVQQKPMQPMRLHVWCGLTASHVIGPYYFDGSVTGESYREMLETFLMPELRRLRLVRTVIFQQDGAPAHTAGATIDWLQATFGDRLISRRCEIKWPARSPDLTPPDFFLWGSLKLKIKQRAPESMDQLKSYIEEEVALLNRNNALLASVFDNFVHRLHVCVQNGGAHVIL